MVEFSKSCFRPTVLASGLRVTLLECPSRRLTNHASLDGLVHRSVFRTIYVASTKKQNHVQMYLFRMFRSVNVPFPKAFLDVRATGILSP